MSSSTALTQKVESGSPYQLDQGQILKASRALLKHIKDSSSSSAQDQGKKDLLAESEDVRSNSSPIWLLLTTKKHIIDKKRLKPALISVPHPLNVLPITTICLITVDPQRTYKDIIASPAFPTDLSKRITRVIDVTKLGRKYSQYEAQRKLYAEHDMFLADDRIITRLSGNLGKTFYGNTTKRPIPVSLQAPAPKSDGKRIATAKREGAASPASAEKIAKEVEKAARGALVHLSPSTHTAVKIGYANWDEKMIAENLEIVAEELIQRFVPGKWRGVRGLHVKGAETIALPIWLADELWSGDGDVVKQGAIEETKRANVGEKRKAVEVLEEDNMKDGKKKEKTSKKQKVLKESDDNNLDKEIALRKETLKKQKEEAAMDAVDDVLKNMIKSKSKSKTKSKKSKSTAA